MAKEKICKKCGKPLSDLSKGKLCQNCKEKQRKRVREGAGIGAGVLSAVLFIITLGRKK
jgi:predicted amidophosphoribosyltransferase